MCLTSGEEIGLSQVAREKVFQRKIGERENLEHLIRFLHGETGEILNKTLGTEGTGDSLWTTFGKRVVCLENARFVLDFFIRHPEIDFQAQRCLFLSGENPFQSCAFWARAGLSSDFLGFEKDFLSFHVASTKRPRTQQLLTKLHPTSKCYMTISYCDLFNLDKDKLVSSFRKSDLPPDIIDLDFCRNEIRTKQDQLKVAQFINWVSSTIPERHFVLSTTMHIGRHKDNAKENIMGEKGHIDSFETLLLTKGIKVVVKKQTPYQSHVPMLSLTWILKRV